MKDLIKKLGKELWEKTQTDWFLEVTTQSSTEPLAFEASIFSDGNALPIFQRLGVAPQQAISAAIDAAHEWLATLPTPNTNNGENHD